MNRDMIWGTLSLTESGRHAVAEHIKDVPDLADLILRSIEDKSAVLDIRKSFRWSPDVDAAIQLLVGRGFLKLEKTVSDRIKDMFVDRLGSQRSQIMITKLDHIYRKNGSCDCQGLEDMRLTATRFFGETTAHILLTEISAILENVDSEVDIGNQENTAVRKMIVMPAIDAGFSSPEY